MGYIGVVKLASIVVGSNEQTNGTITTKYPVAHTVRQFFILCTLISFQNGKEIERGEMIEERDPSPVGRKARQSQFLVRQNVDEEPAARGGGDGCSHHPTRGEEKEEEILLQ